MSINSAGFIIILAAIIYDWYYPSLDVISPVTIFVTLLLQSVVTNDTGPVVSR